MKLDKKPLQIETCILANFSMQKRQLFLQKHFYSVKRKLNVYFVWLPQPFENQLIY